MADRVVFMEEGRIVEQATPPPIKRIGNYGTGTSPALPTDKIVLLALIDVSAVASCPRDQIPRNDFHPRRLWRVVRHA